LAKVLTGLNLIPNACVIPHHNTFGQGWAADLGRLLPDDILIGIEEQTGMIDDGTDGVWTVYGKGVISVYTESKVRIYRPGEILVL
jgi:cyanophycinase